MGLARFLLGIAQAVGPAPAAVPPNRPAVTITVARPDLQLDRLITWFQGSRATDPAAALASWKRATGGKGSLGKAPEAAIAAMNPRMVRELKTLDGSTFLLAFGPQGATTWSFRIPADDGTFASLATASALTEGASEAPFEGSPVDRLGSEGSPLLSRKGRAVILAGSRAALPLALATLPPPRNDAVREGAAPSVVMALDARELSRSADLNGRRLGAILVGLGSPTPTLRVALEEERILAVIDRGSSEPLPMMSADPSWARDLPSSAAIAFSAALDPSPAAWDRRFAALDGIEKADPTKRGAAPVRVRFNLIARAAGLDPERDLWPNLKGVSAFLTGPIRAPEAIVMILHASDAASAATIRSKVLPSLARALRVDRPGTAQIGMLLGRPVLLLEDAGPEVRIAWGIESGRLAEGVRNDPRSSLLGESAMPREVSRRSWIWPQRLGLASPESPIAGALAGSPPIRAWGFDRGEVRDDRVSWDGPRDAIRRFLEHIPQAAPAVPER